MHSARKVAGVATVAALSLTGCGGGDDSGQQADSGPADTRPAKQVAVTADPSKTIARQTFNSPIFQGATLEVGIIDLKVSGPLAHLTLVLTPRNAGSDMVNVYSLNGNSDPDVGLLDTVNLKRHKVVKAGNRPLQPHFIFDKIRNNQATVQTYTFAAPPANVRTVDVSFGQWAPFRSVPVTR
ncbi:hypothetical protein [Actinomadura vinacea]